ncbi:autotransporter domain-containing protein [Bosea vestrisii]|uniref:autotransporter domain-containing protein n=1 Tax=Bosea vestrisii TaxID=151416 RepID=UPI0024DFE0A8|nr:autotransporter domain-containing protein [Bosea vestrisii]WID95436.1 autotransporter domain-containing protein [Bosea vestrisii]
MTSVLVAEAGKPSVVRLRPRLCAGTALVLLCAVLASPALANGGAGGGGGGSVGGLDNPDTAGNAGGNGSSLIGGAGGGAGLSGGAGGSSAGAGGSGGLNPGDSGNPGSTGAAGAGGGGGAHGSVSATVPSGIRTGGAGGAGGEGLGMGGGGGGGAGGWGAVITGAGALGSTGVTATGGAGGAGGAAIGGFTYAGGGGSGGHGLAVTGGAGTSLTLTGVVQGGVGGIGSFALGGWPGSSGGDGGAGLFLSGASTVTINAAVRGGNGGMGGSGGGAPGGVGGAGGGGVFIANGGTVNVNASVVGGLGGNGGVGPVSGAAGGHGAGIAGNNLTVVLGTGGMISDADGAGGALGNALQVNGSSKLTVTAAGTASIIGNIDIASGTLTLDQGAGSSITIANTITGAGALAKDGAGTVTLTGTNTYAGGTTLNAGTLSISADANLGNAASGITFGGASTLQVTGSFTTARAMVLNATGTVEVTAGQNFTMGGTITGAGGLIKAGSGTLILTGSNFYTGGNTISQGTVSVSSDANLGSAGYTITFNNATIVAGAGTGADAVLRTTASFTSGRDIAFTSGGGRIETDAGTTLTLTGAISAVGTTPSFVKQGAGTLVLTGDSSAGYEGRTWVNEGTLRIEAGGKLGSNSVGGQAYISNGATAIVTGTGSSWETFGQMRVGEHGSGTLRIEAGGSVKTGGGSGTVGIVGAGGASSVTITGSGSQWFGNGENLYVGHSNAGSLTVTAGGSLKLGSAGDGTIIAGLSAGGAGGIINIGAAEGSGAVAAGDLLVGKVDLVASASQLVFNHTNVGYTFASSITGDGSVRQIAGITALTGTNDYKGQTQVLGGRLIAGNSTGFSANSDYTVAAGAVLEVAGGAFTAARVGSLSGAGFVLIGLDEMLITGTTNQTATFSGTFFGDGSLRFDGSGTQIYTGTGNLGGDLLICACSTGSFIIRGGSLTFGGGVQVNGGMLLLDQAGLLTAGHNIEVNSGALVVSQGSKLANPGWGVVVFSDLRIDGVGSSVTTDIFLLQGLASNASLIISGGATLTVNLGAAVQAGLGGSASALVTGAGSLWTIPNTFAIGPGSTEPTFVTLAEGGELRITAGDLQIDTLGTLNLGNGGRAGLLTITAGAIVNDGAIVADFTDMATLTYDISGTGTLTKRGSGTLTLTGANTYTGATTVSGGKLVVNGSLTGAVTIDGGALGGSGTVGGIAANAGGTVAPGNSIGTLNVAGNISFASGSTYQVEINPAGQGDKILASGLATISGGTVAVLAERGTYAASTSYTILTAAGGVTGRFADVTSDLVFLTPSLAYDSNNVVLTMSRTATTFLDVASTRNQGFIANAAERLGVGNPIYDTLLSGTAAEARAGFDLLSGEAHAQAVSVMIDESRLVRETILNRLRGPLLTAPGAQVAAAFSADLPGRKGAVLMNAPQPRYTLWGEAFGGAGNTDADGNAGSLSRRSGGALLGADLMLYDAPGSSLKLGVAGGYSQSRFDLDARRSSGKLDSGHAALYAGGRFGNLRLDAGLAYSWSESDIRRQVQIRGFGDSLRLQRPGAVAQGFAELGYGFALSGFALEPFAQLALIRVSTDAGTERGGAAALRVLSSDQTLGFTTLGLRAEAQLGSAPLFARAMLGWRHGFGELTPTASTAFALGTTPARVFAAQIDREALVAEAGLDWRLSSATALGLTYSAAIGERSRDHALKGRVEMRF